MKLEPFLPSMGIIVCSYSNSSIAFKYVYVYSQWWTNVSYVCHYSMAKVKRLKWKEAKLYRYYFRYCDFLISIWIAYNHFLRFFTSFVFHPYNVCWNLVNFWLSISFPYHSPFIFIRLIYIPVPRSLINGNWCYLSSLPYIAFSCYKLDMCVVAVTSFFDFF